MLKFATGVIVVVTAEVLLPGTKSGVLAGVATDALLVMEPTAEPETVPVMVITTLLPTGSCAKVADTFVPDIEKPLGQSAPPEADEQDAVTPFRSAGELSVKLALNTSLGPLFRITMV